MACFFLGYYRDENLLFYSFLIPMAWADAGLERFSAEFMAEYEKAENHQEYLKLAKEKFRDIQLQNLSPKDTVSYLMVTEIFENLLNDFETYEQKVAYYTGGLGLTPKQIHQIGLKEVDRIRREYKEVQKSLSVAGDLERFLNVMRDDPNSYFDSLQELEKQFLAVKKQIDQLVPHFFEKSTDIPLKIKVDSEVGSASYKLIESENPYGVVTLKAGSLKTFPKYEVATLMLHEGIPGHHLHRGLEYQHRSDILPMIYKYFRSNTFNEGWALYVESLGYEIGLFDDPHQRFGHLSDDMLRSARLVVDTGIHAFNWTEEKAVNYLKENLPYETDDLEREVKNIKEYPAFYLSYKMGQLKIKELRSYAQTQLNACFDLKKFHQQVIGSGTLSMKALDFKIKNWASESRDCSGF